MSSRIEKYKKKLLKLKRETEVTFKRNPRSPKKVAKKYSNGLYQILKELFSEDVSGRSCLVAMGSFGRMDMCLASDADVLIIGSGGEDTEMFIRDMWDIGLDVGHTVRSIEETLKLAEDDIKTFTSVFDAKRIAGSRKLFEELKARLNFDKRFLLSLFEEEVRGRWRRFKDLSQPDVIDGPGGLRDFNVIRWISKIFLENELGLEKLLSAKNFLLSVRMAMHIITGRKTDRLYAEIQGDVEKLLDVSELMRKLHITMSKIKTMCDIALDKAAKKVRGDTFAASDNIFDAYKRAKETGLKTDPDIRLKVLGGKAAKLDSKELLEFLSPPGVARILKEMHNVGILEELIPEVRRIKGIHQPYPHTLPLDQHLIACVEEVEALLAGGYPKDIGEIEVKDKNILLLSALLHDIAKGYGFEHETKSAKVARRVGLRLGIRGERLRKLEFLVGEHLAFPDIAQKRDLHDEDVIVEFARKAKDLDTLNCLFLLSIADAKATNPTLWNDWKRIIFTELYMRTHSALSLGLFYIPSLEEEAVRRRKWLERQFEGIFSKSLLESFINEVPSRFLTTYDMNRLFRYCYCLMKSSRSREPLVSCMETPEGFAEFLVSSEDRIGVFAKCAGAFFVCGLNILTAHALSIMGNILDIFWVEPPDPARMKKCEDMLIATLKGEIEIDDLVEEKKSKFKGEKGWAKVVIDNSVSKELTVVEVYCKDRMGLLFDLTSAISLLGLDIALAKISTRYYDVTDVFYVRDKKGKVESKKAKTLKEILEKVARG